MNIYIYTHTHIYIYIWIYIEREGKEGEREKEEERYTLRSIIIIKVTLLKAINIFNHEENIVMLKWEHEYIATVIFRVSGFKIDS